MHPKIYITIWTCFLQYLLEAVWQEGKLKFLNQEKMWYFFTPHDKIYFPCFCVWVAAVWKALVLPGGSRVKIRSGITSYKIRHWKFTYSVNISSTCTHIWLAFQFRFSISRRRESRKRLLWRWPTNKKKFLNTWWEITKNTICCPKDYLKKSKQRMWYHMLPGNRVNPFEPWNFIFDFFSEICRACVF
jgi:hypothetical protein